MVTILLAVVIVVLLAFAALKALLVALGGVFCGALVSGYARARHRRIRWSAR